MFLLNMNRSWIAQWAIFFLDLNLPGMACIAAGPNNSFRFKYFISITFLHLFYKLYTHTYFKQVITQSIPFHGMEWAVLTFFSVIPFVALNQLW